MPLAAIFLTTALVAGAEVPSVDELAWVLPDRAVRQRLRSWQHAESDYAAHPVPPFATYRVDADLDPEAQRLSTRQAVHFVNSGSAPLQRLVFRVLAGRHGRVNVRGAWVGNRPVVHRVEDTLLTLDLHRPLRRGQEVRVLLELDQQLPVLPQTSRRRPHYLNSSQVGALGVEHPDRVHLGHALAVLTPLGPDGFDTRPLPRNGEHAVYVPSDFWVSLTYPNTYQLAATGLVRETQQHGTQVTSLLEARSSREFVAMLGKGWTSSVGDAAGVTLRVHHRADDPLVGRHLLESSKRIVERLSVRFGPMGITELDIVDTPTAVAVGLEFPGLVTIDSVRLGQDGLAANQEWTLAHEIAHQWWSVSVGSDARDEPWLDEALAEHSAALYWEDEYGRREVLDRHSIDLLPALDALGMADERLSAAYAADRYNLSQYAVLIYGRASLFFDALRRSMGDEAHQRALQRYASRHAHRMASPEDLLDAFRAEATNESVVDDLYQHWIVEGRSIQKLWPEPWE